MVAWAEIAERHTDGAKIIDEYGDWGCRGHGDLAVDVMTIVGSILWSGPTFSVLGFRSGERRYDDNLFGRDYTCKIAHRIYHPPVSIVNQIEPIFQPHCRA